MTPLGWLGHKTSTQTQNLTGAGLQLTQLTLSIWQTSLGKQCISRSIVASDQGLHCLSRWLSQMPIRPLIRRLQFDPLRIWQHSFVEIDHERFSVVIISRWFKKGSCQFLWLTDREQASLVKVLLTCYLKFQGTLWNTSRYPYFNISGLQN